MDREHKVVLLDDDFAIRYVIKVFLKQLHIKLKTNLKIYTSDNGVEGLGYIYVTDPDVIIIDTTLPKYSGKELVVFLASNEKFTSDEKTIILLYEEELTRELESSDNFLIVSKKDKELLGKILDSVELSLKRKYPKGDYSITNVNYRFFLTGKLAIQTANHSDLLSINSKTSGVFSSLLTSLKQSYYDAVLSVYMVTLRVFPWECLR